MYATLEDLARAKGVTPTYVSRVLRLTLLAPEIVEAILDGRQRPRRARAGGGGQQESSGMTRATVSADGETITVHIPLACSRSAAGGSWW